MAEASHQVADLVTGIVLLMLVAAFATMLSKRLNKIPLTILLVFVGMLTAAAAPHVPLFNTLTGFHLTPELVLFVFIPTLIFESAFNLDARQVSRNIVPILTLAIPGLLLSTVIIGLIMAGLTDFSLMVALLLGAILSATDPVAVISIFKQLGVPERLTVLVEGESLFNDATSLVLATLLIGMLAAGGFSGEVALAGVLDFFMVFAGGVLVGWLLAVITGYALGAIESDPGIEITLTTILAYLSFVIAEHVFHVSGIMAVVAAGLIIGSWGKSKISPSISEFMEHFWEYLAFLANALIFLMVGLQIDLVALVDNADLIVIVILAMLVSRAIIIFGVVPLLGRIPGAERIELPFRMVMYWGGLRGAIALAIVLSLPPNEYKDTLIAVVMGAVLFTLVVQGLSIETLVRYLTLDRLSKPDNLARLEGDRNARQQGLERLNSLVQGGLFSQRVADMLDERTRRDLEKLDKQLIDLNRSLEDSERVSILALRCLTRERARIYELFARGLINEWAFRELDHTIAVQLDDVRHRNQLPTANIRTSLGMVLDRATTRVLEHIPGLTGLAERRRTVQIIRDYDVAWGRYRSANSVIHDFEKLSGEGESTAESTREVKAAYTHILETTKAQIDEVAELYPEFVETMQETLGQRLLLVAEHDSVEHAAELGMLQEGIAETIMKDQEARIRELKQDKVSSTLEIGVHELLAKLPIFKELEDEFDSIAAYLRPRTVPKGTPIVKQGQPGDSMFLIARGVASIWISDNNDDKQVANLYAGEFFGEAALLHQEPRNASAYASTPCSLYELKRADLNTIMSRYPRVKERVEEIDQMRIKENTQTGYPSS